MALITNLKFGEVDNLSDARFAAGSEAAYIGFSFDPDHEFYIEPDKAEEIINWLKGPAIVGEFGAQELHDINKIVKRFNLKYVQLNETTNFFSLKELKVKIIQNIDLAEFRSPEEVEFFVEESYKNVTYYMLSIYDEDEYEEYMSDWENEKLVKKLCQDLNVILNFPFDADNIRPLVQKFKPYAVNLYPGGEDSPGMKDFDGLIEVVESLQENL